MFESPVDRGRYQNRRDGDQPTAGPAAPRRGFPPEGRYRPAGSYRPDGSRASGSAFPGLRDAVYDRPAHRAVVPPPPGSLVIPTSRQRPADASWWHWLLLLPVVLPLLTPLYNRIEPTLFGFPFFYWFQLALAMLSSGVLGVVHTATRKRA